MKRTLSLEEMTRKDLAKQIADRTGISQNKAERLIIAFGDVVGEVLSRNEKIVYSNFGTFYTVHYPSKTIFHPIFGAEKKMVMLPTDAVKWMPSGNIKELVKNSQVVDSPTRHGTRKMLLGSRYGYISPAPEVEVNNEEAVQQINIKKTDNLSPENTDDEIEIPINKSTNNRQRTNNKPVAETPNTTSEIQHAKPFSPSQSESDIPKAKPVPETRNTTSDIPHTKYDIPNDKPVNIYEELMHDGSKEVSTFKDAIRVPSNKSFWGRVFKRKNDATGNKEDGSGDGNSNTKISLVDSGMFQKDEVTRPISQGYGEKRIDSIKSELSKYNSPENIDTVKKTEKTPEPAKEIDIKPFPSSKPDISFIDLSKTMIPKEILAIIPEKLARKYKAVPIENSEKGVVVAMVDPEDIEARELIKKHVQRPLLLKLVTETDINFVLDQYSGLETEVKQAIESGEKETRQTSEETKAEESVKILSDSASDNAPASRIVTSLLRRAIRDKASDIHIEPTEKEVEVRFRLDGVLKKKISLPIDIEPAIISRIKILSNLKIDEQRLPQDGRFSLNFDDRQIDFRVSTMPVAYGEKVVMRVLDKISGILTIEQLGIRGSGLETVKENISKSHGMTLVTGPTGSGKTTTLYALIDKLYNEGVNIVTLEDPIEYRMPGINQSQVNSAIDYTFASGLRSIVRQDPDIIMIGEIRDAETAEMAVHAALTGHIVLSTLHTNDATGAAPRLLDMGVEPFLLTSALNMVVGQRLARKICDNCKEEFAVSDVEKKKIEEEIAKMPEVERKSIEGKEMKFHHGKGCKNCGDSGYKGRVGLYEVLGMNEKIKEMILKKDPSSVIQEEAIKAGMVTMLQDGVLKALEGVTTLEEVWRVTKD